jgi:hypothetical protein
MVLKAQNFQFSTNVALAYNVLWLCEGRASRHKSSNIAQCLIVAQMFNKPLMPCFCKTLVMGRCGLIKTN